MRKTIGLALLVVVVALVLFWRAASCSKDEERVSIAPGVEAPPSTSSSATPPSLPAPDQDIDPDEEPPTTLPTDGAAPYPVDLEAMRASMPDNLYWVLGAPTKDPAVLRMREERARSSNELYGKVLSTTATEEEIERYYSERQRVSGDYIQFAERVLAEHREELPEEHIGMYELSLRLHRARLDQIPRDKQDALTRLHAKQGR